MYRIKKNQSIDFNFADLFNDVNTKKINNKKRSKRITITIDKNLLNFLDHLISKRIFANRSHAFEFLIRKRTEFENERENYYYLK